MINQTVLKLGQKIVDGCFVFLRADNSNKTKFRSKLGSNNSNVKNFMFGFKIRTKGPYFIFFRSGKFDYLNRTNFYQS